jgi:cation diffusion facilitator family transporter
MDEDGKRVALSSIFLNIVLFCAKGGIALLSGSTAVLAETIHSFTDITGSLAIWVGITISLKKSPSFPWGLYKVENVAAIISSFFIVLMTYEVGRNIFSSGAKGITNVSASMAVLLLMTIPIFLFARYEKKKALELNSPSLRADAQHWMADIAPIGVVIAGLAGAMIYPHADKIASIVIIIFVLKSVYRIAKDSMKSLLDASVDAATIEKMRLIVGRFKEVEKITELNARNSGRFIFVLLNVRLSVKKLKEAHEIADTIEREIKKEISFVDRVTIHYEPWEKEFVRYAVPLEKKEGEISEHFGSAPYIAFWNKNFSNGTVMSPEVMENPFVNMERGKGIKLAEFLIEHGVNVLYAKKPFEHKGPEYVFSNAEVEIRITDLRNLEDVIRMNKEDTQ